MKTFARIIAAIFLSCAICRAQQVTLTPGSSAVGGVAISTSGFMEMRQTAGAPASAARTAASADLKKDSSLLYVSLPRVIDAWKSARDAGRQPIADVRFLHGLARIDDVFIFPEAHDIVLAGPGEPVDSANPLEPKGKITGRPMVQLEDLIVAMRAVAGTLKTGVDFEAGRDFYGCSLEAPANLRDVWQPTIERYENGPRNVLRQEMRKALGPQQVKLFGVPGDSRVALVMVAADYRLKRMCMGLENLPAGVGNAIGNQDAAASIWFEPSYDPLLVSADGDSYEFRGPRLKVLAGAQEFNPTGATEAQKRFAEKLSAKIPDVAAKIDAVADLQNLTDCFMLAALIRHDRLDEKAGVDFSWLLSPGSDGRYPTTAVPVPKTAQSVVAISGNAIAQGGVKLRLAGLLSAGRDGDPQAQFLAAADRPAADWFLEKKP